MNGMQIHQQMLSRCEVLMSLGQLNLSQSEELSAVAAACEAFESVIWPMGYPVKLKNVAHNSEPKA